MAHSAGAPVPGSWGQQQKEGLKKQDQHAAENEARRVAEGGEADQQAFREQEMQKDQAPLQSREPLSDKGEDRTPDQTIGQVAHADKTGGAGDPEVTPLEPEKQGGIGGP